MRCGVDFIDETLSQAEGMRGKDKCKWNEKGCFWIYEILWETPPLNVLSVLLSCYISKRCWLSQTATEPDLK